MSAVKDTPFGKLTAAEIRFQKTLFSSMERNDSFSASSASSEDSNDTSEAIADGNKTPTAMTDDTQADGTKPSPAPARKTIDDCIRDLNLHEAPKNCIDDPLGDSYIFIDPVARLPGQSEHQYLIHHERYKNPIVMRSDNLAQCSPLLKEMLGPTRQYRMLRRRGLVGRLPERIKYVLDLTPPSEGDDAVYLTASLSCSQGIRSWYKATGAFGVAATLVGGKDEQDSLCSESSKEIPEYSPLRHRAAVEQCLAAMSGRHIDLDSAVKVWSITILIEYFGITSASSTYLIDCILTWIRAEPNNCFLEINMEESLRIAAILQNSSLTRDVFAMLVGEEALEYVVKARRDPIATHCSIFGRRKEALPEIWQDRVEYAAKAFLQSQNRFVEDLFANDLKWVERIFNNQVPEHLVGNPLLRPIYEKLLQALKNYVQVMLYACLLDGTSHWEQDLPDFAWGTSSSDQMLGYNDLFPSERTLTRTFWHQLKENISWQDRDYARHRWPSFPYNFTSDPLFMKISPMAHEDVSLTILEDIIKEGQLCLPHAIHLEFSSLGDNGAAANAAQPPRDSASSAAVIDRPNDIQIKDFNNQDDEFELFELELYEGGDEAHLGSLDNPVSQIPKPVNAVGPRVRFADQDSQPNEAYPGALSELTPAHSGLAAAFSKYQGKPRRRLFFSLNDFWARIEHHLACVANKQLDPPDLGQRDNLNLRLTKTLVSLSDAEWKYLPLWADGLDDGTGAIYTEDVMEAAPGSDFSTPGPSIHTGSSTWSSSTRGTSDYDMMSDTVSLDTETINISTAVADGHSDQLFRGKVYTPSGSSAASTMDEIDREMGVTAEEERARLVVRTLEREQEVQRDRLAKDVKKEEHKSAGGKTDGMQELQEGKTLKIEDACYDDLFIDPMDEDDDDDDDEEEEEEDDDDDELDGHGQ